MSVGSSLREVRESSGLSIAELAARTRIPANVISDLENDRFGSSGGVSYARGHVRTIAAIYGIDPEPLLSQFESQTVPLSKSIRDLLNENSVVTNVKREAKLSWKAIAGFAALILIAILVVMLISSGGKSAQSSSANTSPSLSQSPSPEKVTGVKVIIRSANGKSWISVTDSSGVEQFNAQVAQGEERAFSDPTYFDLWIGNAGALDIEVNGKNLGRLGKVGEVVRTRIGPNGIETQN